MWKMFSLDFHGGESEMACELLSEEYRKVVFQTEEATCPGARRVVKVRTRMLGPFMQKSESYMG